MSTQYVATVEVPEEVRHWLETITSVASLPEPFHPLLHTDVVQVIFDNVADEYELAGQVHELNAELASQHWPQIADRPQPVESTDPLPRP